MKIIVFGGSGFLGSHAADKLSQAGHEVSVFDSRPSPWLRPDQTFISGDILDAETVAQSLQGAEAVFNYIAVADLSEANREPLKATAVNIVGNANILEAAAAAGVKRFILASSLYVGGCSGGVYRVSKQAAELYVEHYHQQYGLPYTILRYGSLYGPRSKPQNGIHGFVRQALSSGRIVYNGHAEALREYIHVEDAALASVEMLRPEYEGQTILLTGRESMRVADLFKMIAEILGRPLEIVYKPDDRGPHYDVTPYAFRPRLARKFTPRLSTDLGQGIVSIMEEIYGDISS